MKQIDKIKVEDVKPSSRQYPYIRFEVLEKEKLHRQAIEVENLSHAWDGAPPLFNNLNLTIQNGERIAIIASGITRR
jgi:ATPase subunit of ABC transporter with duplicated ATPase domains